MARKAREGVGHWRVAGGVIAVGTLWVLLAVLRPEVTYHLAPALVVWAGPYLAGGPMSRALLATGGSAGFAVVLAMLLSAGGVLGAPSSSGVTRSGRP